MSTVIADPFVAMIRDVGEGHLVDWYPVTQLRKLLEEADKRAHERLGINAPRLTPETLVQEYTQNPHKVRAYLQILTSASPDMLVMAWRILQGMGIASVRLQYDAELTFHLRVSLFPLSPYETDDQEVYESTEIDDAVVLRHMGISKMNGRPLFDGFYALNLSKNAG